MESAFGSVDAIAAVANDPRGTVMKWLGREERGLSLQFTSIAPGIYICTNHFQLFWTNGTFAQRKSPILLMLPMIS